MQTRIAFLAAALLAAHHLEAQDVGLFATAGRHQSWRPLIYGAGVSLSGFTRLGNVMGPAAGPLQRSDLHVGVRLAYSELRYTQRSSGYYCATDLCVPVPVTSVERRLGTYHLALLVLPYRTRWTHIELGGGIDATRRAFAFSGLLGTSHRLSRERPLWATIAWEPRKWFQETIADGPSLKLPGHSFRAGLSYNVRGR